MPDRASRRGIPPRFRRIAAVALYVTAFLFLTGGNPFPEVRGRLGILRRSWWKTLPERRLEGTAAAYDRRFAALLAPVRDALPPGTPGIALYAPGIPEWGGLFLAVYEIAPIPVLIGPKSVPSGWLVLSYGENPPREGRVIRRFEGGVLLAPSS
jgi:hypothetical protein